jgi:hypothetical protein
MKMFWQKKCFGKTGVRSKAKQAFLPCAGKEEILISQRFCCLIKKRPVLLQVFLYRVRDSNPYRLREREVS